eukprot:scaffold3722_cov263-Pinguiococcus_pyrenoidosus.AAC.6
MARIYRRNSMSLEEYAGNVDALESSKPYGRVTTRECRLLQRLLPDRANSLPNACQALPKREAPVENAMPTLTQTSISGTSALATQTKVAAFNVHAISRKECEKLADILLTEIHGGGAFLPVSCRRVELQKRRQIEREQDRRRSATFMADGFKAAAVVPKFYPGAV